MPSKQVEDVYDAGGFDGGPLGRPGSVENRQDGRAAEAKARRAALADAAAEIAALERAAKEPYATAYRKAKEKVLAMIEVQ